MEIKSISNIPKTVFSKCRDVGASACQHIKQLPQKVDEFVKSDSFNSFKGKVKEHNKALIGAAIILAATGLAIKSVKSMKKELEKVKNK